MSHQICMSTKHLQHRPSYQCDTSFRKSFLNLYTNLYIKATRKDRMRLAIPELADRVKKVRTNRSVADKHLSYVVNGIVHYSVLCGGRS